MANTIKNEKIAGKKTAAKAETNGSKFHAKEESTRAVNVTVTDKTKIDGKFKVEEHNNDMKNVNVSSDTNLREDARWSASEDNQVKAQDIVVKDETGRVLTGADAQESIKNNIPEKGYTNSIANNDAGNNRGYNNPDKGNSNGSFSSYINKNESVAKQNEKNDIPTAIVDNSFIRQAEQEQRPQGNYTVKQNNSSGSPIQNKGLQSFVHNILDKNDSDSWDTSTEYSNNDEAIQVPDSNTGFETREPQKKQENIYDPVMPLENQQSQQKKESLNNVSVTPNAKVVSNALSNKDKKGYSVKNPASVPTGTSFTVKNKNNINTAVNAYVSNSAGMTPGHATDDMPDGGDEQSGYDSGAYINERGRVKKSNAGAKWTTKNHNENGHAVARATVETIKSQYDESDAVQGEREIKDKADKFAIFSGAKVLGRAGIVNSAASGMYHSTVKGNGADKIKKYTDELGSEYIVGIKNSYGNVQKDIKNNIRVLDNYFSKRGIDFTGWTQKDFEKALKSGIIKNKAGENIKLSSLDKDPEKIRFFLKERAGFEKRKSMLKAIGSWKDDVANIADSLYGDTDAAQGLNVARNVRRGAKVGAAVGSSALSGTINTGISAVNGVRRGINTAKGLEIKAQIRKAKKAGKDVTVLTNKAKELKNKNIAIKNATARWKGKVKHVAKHPIKTASTKAEQALGKQISALNSRIYANTIGKTKLGEKLAEFYKKHGKGGLVKGSLGRAKLKIAAHDTPIKKLIRKVIHGLGKVSIIVGLCVVIVIFSTGPIVGVLGWISEIFPAVGDSSVAQAAENPMGSSKTASGRMWDNAKIAMQSELEDISDDAPKFLAKEHKAFLKKGLNLKLTYKEEYVFAGFAFKGSANEICYKDQREVSDGDGSKKPTTPNTTGDADAAASTSSSLVGSKSTASYGPMSGSNKTNLTKSKGTVTGPSGKETYYNMDMANCVHTLDLHCRGKNGLSKTAHYWVRSDGVKMYGDENGISYVMVAADLSIRPKGTIVATSLGPGIVADTGAFAATNHKQLDIAVSWGSQYGGAASGNVDTWGVGGGGGGSTESDLCAGGASDNGVNASGYNFFRAILAMANAATDGEDDPAHQEFYNAYCVHLIKNAYNYSKYYTCKQWRDTIDANPDRFNPFAKTKINKKGSKDDPDSAFGLSSDNESLKAQYGPAFEVKEIDRDYSTNSKTGKKTLKSITYGVTLNFLSTGLWGDYTITGEDDDFSDDVGTESAHTKEDPGRAGIASKYDKQATAVGMFDVEENEYKVKAPSGKWIKTQRGTDSYMHSIGGGANKSEAYEQTLKIMPDYNEWEGYRSETERNGVQGDYIFENGDETSRVEATYEIADSDLRDEGIYVDGIYNISNLGDENSAGGAASNPLSDAEMASIVADASTNNPQRKNAILVALKLVGTATYNMKGPGPNMHSVPYVSGRGKGHIENYPSDYREWKSQSDCSGYVSYILYKSGAKKFTAKEAYNTSLLRDNGSAVSGARIKPGDIIIKTNGNVNGHYDSHVVMYIGKTSKGNFTVAECTTRNGHSGPQLNGYSSIQDFWDKRGADYKYIRNYFGG